MTAETIIRALTATFPEKVRQMHADLARGYDVTPSPSFLRELAEAHLDEPARLAAARAEGVREGIEMAAGHLEEKAAGFFADRDAHMRAWEASKSSRAEEVHQRRACSAEVVASSLLGWAAKLRALAPAPAEAPTTPTVEESDGWIEWVCRPLVPLGTLVEIECDDGARHGPLPVEGWIWDATGPNPIRAYRIVQPAEASAPVAPDLETGVGRATTTVMATERVQAARIAALEAENEKLLDRLKGTLAHLVAAHSELGRRRRVPLMDDYAAEIARARALLQGQEGASCQSNLQKQGE